MAVWFDISLSEKNSTNLLPADLSPELAVLSPVSRLLSSKSNDL